MNSSKQPSGLIKIRDFLAYVEWLAASVCFVAIGWSVQPRSVIGAVFFYVFAALILYQMFDLSSKKLTPANRITSNKFMGNPILDIVLIVICFQAYFDSQEWVAFGIAGLVYVFVDLTRWLLSLMIGGDKR